MYESGIIAKADPISLNSRLSGVSSGNISVVNGWVGNVIAVVMQNTIVTSSDTIVRLLIQAINWGFIVIADVKTESSWVNVAMAKEEQSTEDWFGKNVEDTVEDSLGVG